MQNKFSVKVGNLAQEGGGGLTQSQLLQITVFMAYLTLFCRKFLKNSRKKSQPLGRGRGSSRLGQIPNFYRKFVSWASLIIGSEVFCSWTPQHESNPSCMECTYQKNYLNTELLWAGVWLDWNMRVMWSVLGLVGDSQSPTKSDQTSHRSQSTLTRSIIHILVCPSNLWHFLN